MLDQGRGRRRERDFCRQEVGEGDCGGLNSPEFFKKSLDKLKQEQRNLSKKQKGSKNKEKQRIKVAKVHQHISNQRNDFLHKLTTGLIKESQFDVFCLEDLNLKGMSKLWGRKVSDLSYYTFQ